MYTKLVVIYLDFVPISHHKIVARELDEMVDDKVGCPIRLFNPILRGLVNYMCAQNG